MISASAVRRGDTGGECKRDRGVLGHGNGFLGHQVESCGSKQFEVVLGF